MRRAIYAFLSLTSAHFGAETVPGPASAFKSPNRCSASRISPPPTHTHLKEPTPMPTAFVRSPFATQDSLTPIDIDDIGVLFADGDVQRAAGRLALKRQKIAEMAGYRSAISEAVAAAGNVREATPQQIVAILGRLSEEADEELAGVREDHAAHDAVRKVRRDHLAPLASKVSATQSRLSVERDWLLRRLDAAERLVNGPGDAIRQRYDMLVASGLKVEEINGLGFRDPSEDAQAKQAAMRVRLDEVNALLTKLTAYSADPRRNPVHLEGLGLDALVAAVYPERATEVPA